MLSDEVKAFVGLGPLPGEDADEAVIAKFAESLLSIAEPVSDAEAKALVDCFGPDSCFGLAWTLLHKIETAASQPLVDPPSRDANEWVQLLWERAHR